MVIFSLEWVCKSFSLVIPIGKSNILHGFQEGRGTGTAIMELKIAQELSIVDHNPLSLVLFDLWKAYGTMDREHLIKTSEGYGVGTCM